MKNRTLAFALAVTAFVQPSDSFADILIGVAAPLTGGSASVGEQFRKGAQQAADDVNAMGGISGEPVKLIFGDDASNPKEGVSVANRLAASNVKYVIGHYNSGVSIPASEIYAENGILQISPGSTNPTLTERGLTNVFRVCGRDDQQGSVAADFISKHHSDKKLAIINDKTAYGAGIAGEVKKNVNLHGITELINEGINVGDKDFSAIITRLKSAGIEVVYFGGVHTEVGLFVRQSQEQGYKPIVISGDDLVSSEFGQIAGDSAVGTFMTFPPDPRANPNAKKIVEKLRAGGFEPEAYTIYSYAALQILKAAIERSKSENPEAVAEWLHTGNSIETVLGSIVFNSKGDRIDEDYTIYQWKKDRNGKIEYAQWQ